jgi:hypothetical protein
VAGVLEGTEMADNEVENTSRRALLKGAVGTGIAGGLLLAPKILEVPAYAASSSGVSAAFCCAWWSPRQPKWHSLAPGSVDDACSISFTCPVAQNVGGSGTGNITLSGNPLDSGNPMVMSISESNCGILLDSTGPVCGQNNPTCATPQANLLVDFTPRTWALGIVASTAGPSGSYKNFTYYAGRQEGKGSAGCGSNLAAVDPRCRLYFRFKVVCT